MSCHFFDATFLKEGKVKFLNKTFDTIHTEFAVNEIVDALIRPEDINVTKYASKAKLSGIITKATYRGSYYNYEIDVKGTNILIETPNKYEEGTQIHLDWDIDAIHLMKKEKEEVSNDGI